MKDHRKVIKLYGPNPMYGTREKFADGKLGKYIWKSHDKVYTIVTNIARYLVKMELCPEVVDDKWKVRPLGILCKTREEWLFHWFATWYFNGCIVPLYDTLTEEDICWIIDKCEIKAVVTTTGLVSKLTSLKMQNKAKSLTDIITLEELTEEESKCCTECKLNIHKYNECLKIGEESKIELHPTVTPNTVATICYTSGTTGKPKGAILTHKNYVTMALAIDAVKGVNLMPVQTGICWLPLAHVMEQFVAIMGMIIGARMGFYSGDVKGLLDDLRELKPEYFGSVPRVFNMIYEKTTSEISKLTGFKKWLYNKAVETKLAALRSTGCNTHAFYDKIVFKKIRNALGGKEIVIFLGGAPATPEIIEMSRIWLSCLIFQGYGQTESTGPIMAHRVDDLYPGSIGSTLIHAEGKLCDVPEMDYYSTDKTDGLLTPRGEIMIRGGGISPGYWRDPKLTEEIFTKDGWLHTGDVGKISPWGNMVIIDRKRNIFKLNQGVYITPDSLENLYQLCKYIKQIFVTGNGLYNYIVAIIVPDKENALKWAKKKKVPEDYISLCNNEDFKLDILQDLSDLGRREKRNGLEIIRNAYLTTKEFSVKENTMTPTQKIKRFEAERIYKKEIEQLYKMGPVDLKRTEEAKK